MSILTLKVKSKLGQIVFHEVSHENTITELRKALSRRCNIEEDNLNVLAGFPPKHISIDDNEKSLLDMGINSGDTLIVEEKVTKPVENVNIAEYEQQVNARGLLLRKVVPSDNSCLFTSVGFVISGKIDTGCGEYMRQLIVAHVKADSETYNEAILGKPPAEYCQWISNPNSWGGAIELSILCKYYGIEIAVVDTINAIINRFGEDQSFPHRVLLIFDGIHYDPLYLESPQTGEMQTIFPIDDALILADAQLLAEESKSSRQFTDVSKFQIKCLVCSAVLKGQVEAQAHAQATGHVNFGEL